MKGQIKVLFSTEIARQVGRFCFGWRVPLGVGLNREQWRFLVANGGRGWWRKSLERWKWFWMKERRRNGVFPKLHESKGWNAQMRNALGNRSFAHTPDIFSKIPTVRLWTSVLWSCRPNFETIQRLTKAGQHFYRGNFMWLPWEASLRGFLKKLPCNFFEKFSQKASLRS